MGNFASLLLAIGEKMSFMYALEFTYNISVKKVYNF